MPVRAADAADLDDVLRLVSDGVPEVHRDEARALVSRAVPHPDGECRCWVSRDRGGGGVTGFALAGLTAGAIGAGRIRYVAVTPLARRRGVGRELVEACCRDLAAEGARFVLAEVPDEDLARYYAALLEGCGFREEARARDLVRDGVAMRFLRRELAPA